MGILACGGRISDVPGANGTSGGTSGGSGGSGTSGGISGGSGTSEDPGAPADPSTTVDAARPRSSVCEVDADCNHDPAVSSLEGTCFEGTCICHDRLHVQLDGKCGKLPPPDCTAAGGTCLSPERLHCPDGQVPGADSTNESCGDLAFSTCCFDASQCRGPLFFCCGQTGVGHDPICENGFLTCPAGFSAKASRCG